jgi:hypothetical protein
MHGTHAVHRAYPLRGADLHPYCSLYSVAEDDGLEEGVTSRVVKEGSDSPARET